ncbi:hypothetical protein HY441_01285, partial [Candidatus Microgenomates bacterium]|nr:hypothetical protein [Candidatus Microgenomates bacterium]
GLDWLTKTYMVAKADKNWREPIGVLNADKIKELGKGFDNKIVYLSGPEPMVETLEKQLKATGLPKSQIKTDFFPGYKEY